MLVCVTMVSLYRKNLLLWRAIIISRTLLLVTGMIRDPGDIGD